MLTRKDGTPVTIDNLTDEDVVLTRWNVLDDLATEEDIAGYLQAAIMDIEDGECDASFLFEALADVAKARAVNQLAKETGIDRKVFCDMLSEGTTNGKAPQISHDAILKVANSFVVPALAQV